MKNTFEEIKAFHKHKPPRSLSRKHTMRSKLPILTQNQSSYKLTSKPPLSESQKRFSTGIRTPEHSLSLIPKIWKSNTSMEEEYSKLDLLSQRNNTIHYDYLNIQQRLIELASNSKLPAIKEVPQSAAANHKIISQVDSILQKYHDNIKQKLKALGNNSFNL
ncbi:hypothetical protein SteCoe_32009 [Stentor coeruleus]|uniref:Uncharacterized protein n=1 Tax=Stentor coeruleus TaxID=5963 RepID=A0A1R2B009_9CILI|nr:hypothetical protein SteCoe_32009 [Stentor coeruleus]